MEMSRLHQDATTVQQNLLAQADQLMVTDGLKSPVLNDFQKSRYWQELALTYIRKEPVDFGKSFLLGVFHLFFNLDTRKYEEVFGNPVTVMDIKSYPNLINLAKAFVARKGAAGLLIGGLIAVYLLVTYAGAALGIFISWKHYPDKPFLLMILLLILYFILVTGPTGLARYKLPAIPFYLVFTGIGYP